MHRVERRTVVPAPPDVVFAYVAELDNLPRWQSGVVETQRTTDGPMGVGARARVVRQVLGQRIEAPLTVFEHDPPRRLGIESTVSGVHARATLDLVPVDAGSTEVTFAMELRASGLTSFMEPMIASAAGGDLADGLARLKAVLSAPA